MVNRIIGVLKLDAATFEEIEADQTATGQAALVVIVVALVSGFFGGLFADNFIGSFLGSVISTLIGWVVWSAVTYYVGTSLFEGKADLNEMLRVIGFSYAPQILSWIPCVGILTVFWSLAAGFVAVRQGLDLDNTKAALTILVGVIVYIILAIVVGIIFGVSAFGLSVISNVLGG